MVNIYLKFQGMISETINYYEKINKFDLLKYGQFSTFLYRALF